MDEAFRSACPRVWRRRPHYGYVLSIGSTDPLNREYLRNLAGLAKRFERAWLSDHLCWTGVGGHNLHDLMPLPYTDEVIMHVARRVRAVSGGEQWRQPEHCGETVLVWRTNENVSYRRIDTAECRALRAAADGATFAAMCQAAAALHADADPAATINAMLAQWLDGVLVRD
ncbi:MAG: multinuclear nonheme iron-dependent oxidase [Candidatus Binataceae bacterium]